MKKKQAQSLIEDDKIVEGWKDGAIFNLDFISASVKIPMDDWDKAKEDLRKIINEN